jgi:putative addiction module component (TIGR02574 family)
MGSSRRPAADSSRDHDLPRDKRLELLELISESLTEDLPPLSDAQKKLVSERLAKHRQEPRRGSALRDVLSRLRSRK